MRRESEKRCTAIKKDPDCKSGPFSLKLVIAEFYFSLTSALINPCPLGLPHPVTRS